MNANCTKNRFHMRSSDQLLLCYSQLIKCFGFHELNHVCTRNNLGAQLLIMFVYLVELCYEILVFFESNESIKNFFFSFAIHSMYPMRKLNLTLVNICFHEPYLPLSFSLCVSGMIDQQTIFAASLQHRIYLFSMEFRGKK